MRTSCFVNVFSLEKNYNIELRATGYLADRVYSIGKSFTASVDAARSCKPVLEALSQLSPSAAPSETDRAILRSRRVPKQDK